MVTHMKWWGWGDEDVTFTHGDKPALAPFVRERIGVDLDGAGVPPVNAEELNLPGARVPPDLRDALVRAVGAGFVTDDDTERVVHAYGKSLRDLVRIRRGDLGRPPDVVVYPADEQEVVHVLEATLAADAVLIPFGGGSNIAGSIEPARDEPRPVISIDLGRMDKVLEVDPVSRLARIEAGALGPRIEEQLEARGWTLGHFPDSFAHSSLGGWIATRSSGMQSDRYGDIADITRALRVATPHGILHTRPVPATSTGPSVREMILGSEGRLGIITEATVHVHRVPERRSILGYLFPDWPTGLAAMQAIAESDAEPIVTRISDANETAFSFATRKQGTRISGLISSGMQRYLRTIKRYDLADVCLAFIGSEGSPSHVRATKRHIGRIVRAHRGICIGAGPGELYDQKKFDTPYIRDLLLDHGGVADVSETAATWSGLLSMWELVRGKAEESFETIGVQGWIMCHLSHSYHSGACLYFTFAFRPTDATAGRGALEQYDVVKGAIQDAFLAAGGTVSHHHAVGTEHARWLGDDLSAPGVEMIESLLRGTDPGRNLNPGKIVP
jgi:alkyldihydroxyacetonephosphate synthase